jgi:hypothetical protein
MEMQGFLIYDLFILKVNKIYTYGLTYVVLVGALQTEIYDIL